MTGFNAQSTSTSWHYQSCWAVWSKLIIMLIPSVASIIAFRNDAIICHWLKPMWIRPMIAIICPTAMLIWCRMSNLVHSWRCNIFVFDPCPVVRKAWCTWRWWKIGASRRMNRVIFIVSAWISFWPVTSHSSVHALADGYVTSHFCIKVRFQVPSCWCRRWNSRSCYRVINQNTVQKVLRVVT